MDGNRIRPVILACIDLVARASDKHGDHRADDTESQATAGGSVASMRVGHVGTPKLDG
jgi:hypothetical protein